MSYSTQLQLNGCLKFHTCTIKRYLFWLEKKLENFLSWSCKYYVLGYNWEDVRYVFISFITAYWLTGRLFFLYSWSQKILITSHCIFPGFNCGDSRTREAKGWTWNCIEEGVFLYLPVIYLSYTQKNVMYREIWWCCYPIIKLQLGHLSFSCFYLSISTTVILRVCLCVWEWISSVSTTSYVLQHQSQRFF